MDRQSNCHVEKIYCRNTASSSLRRRIRTPVVRPVTDEADSPASPDCLAARPLTCTGRSDRYQIWTDPPSDHEVIPQLQKASRRRWVFTIETT